MAGIGADNDFVEEIGILESMFGGTVSVEVIASVIESCDGNVYLAADAIMNFADEMSTPSQEATESLDVRPVQVTPVLNVDAQPFEYRQPQTTTYQSSLTVNQQSAGLQVPISQGQELPTSKSLQSPKSVNRKSATNANQLTSTTTSQKSHITVDQEPSTTAGQQSPTTVNEQSSTIASHQLAATTNMPTFARQQSSISASQPPIALNQQPTSTAGPLSTAEALSVSFPQAFRNSGALPKKPPDSKPPKPRYTMKNVWQDQVGKILHYHNQGTRTLIIMRGVSGSGKSHLAKHIVDYTIGPSPQNYSRHIFSSDSFFMRRGVYQFNRESLQEAHSSNQRNVWNATNKGVSPIIVDNTNTELWEMEPYIRDGVRNGYMIEFVEPNTPWARNANQLEKRNSHGVSRDNIRRMLERYEKGITPESAMKALRLTYPPNKQPPVLRNIPAFSLPGSPRESPKRLKNKVDNYKDQASNASRVEITHHENPNSHNYSGERQNVAIDQVRQNVAINQVAETENSPDIEMLDDEHEIKLKKILEAQRKIEQFEKVEQEWENGVSWDATSEEDNALSQSSVSGFGSIVSDPKPPRAAENKDTEKLKEANDSDWTKFMMPWHDSNISNSVTAVETPVQVECKSIGTGFEVEDMNEHMHAVLYGISRDINEGVPQKNRPKIPKTIILDKSTSTHDNDFLSKKEVCKNKEHHFRELRRMFKSVPRDSLRDIFESCNFDANWAVDLVLDSHPESQENANNANCNVTISDEEDEGPTEECNCLAGYNIVPDMTIPVEISSPQEPENARKYATPAVQKKSKRENKLSDNSLQLKRQIESNVTIPDNHYSQHYLNLRRRRENNIDAPEKAPVLNNASTENIAHSNLSRLDESENATALPDDARNTFNYPTNFRDVAGPSTSHYNLQFIDDDPMDSDTDSESNKSDNLESTVTINLGREFLAKLDEVFGRKDFVYPENIQPVVTLPMSILQQINAHWAVSVAAQMDEGSRQSEAMIKQDEDFARQLADKEQEMSEEGKEPEVLSLPEIMDMELAYSIHERGVAEWRNNEPQDMAARLSREKLYNLFPDMSKEVLSEILMAHDYNFKATIESLIVSTGESNWLEHEKGVEKFVMHKEMERKEKFLEEQNKNLDEAEWPYLTNPDKPVTLETVNYYRAEAEKSLQCRNTNYEKARQYFARNNPSAASFYSEIAALHTRKYEQSSCLAAAYLMNFHLMKNPDHDVLDLHYLRVPEAMVNLDMFLDQIILKLRTKNIRSKETWIITGKGLHSVGGPRIKPATKRRLKAREITSKLVNGGLLIAELRPTDKMTSELIDNSS